MAGNGLRLVMSQGMEGFTGNLREFDIDPTNTGAIYYGDVVAWAASGFVAEATGATDNDDFDILGIFMGCRYVDTDGSIQYSKHWDGGANRSDIRAHVAMPAGCMITIKGDATGTYTKANTEGHRFGIDYAAGSAVTGVSAVNLGAAADSAGPILIHGLHSGVVGNSYSSDEPVFIGTIVRPQGAPAVIA